MVTCLVSVIRLAVMIDNPLCHGMSFVWKGGEGRGGSREERKGREGRRGEGGREKERKNLNYSVIKPWYPDTSPGEDLFTLDSY